MYTYIPYLLFSWTKISDCIFNFDFYVLFITINHLISHSVNFKGRREKQNSISKKVHIKSLPLSPKSNLQRERLFNSALVVACAM